MKPWDFLIDFALDRLAPAAFILLVCMAFSGWLSFFRVLEQRDAARDEKAEAEEDLQEVSQQLNELRASVAAGWPITF